MNACLSEQQQNEFLRRGFSRRSFGRIAALVSGGAAALPFFNEPAMAQLSALHGPIPADAVMINANENPLGPCPEAREAVRAIVDKGGRYLYQETFGFQDTMAELEGLKSSYMTPFAGSSARCTNPWLRSLLQPGPSSPRTPVMKRASAPQPISGPKSSACPSPRPSRTT